MHELTIIDQLIRTSERELQRAKARGPVRRVSLKVGCLSCASPEALSFAFETLAPGTVLEGARLEIDLSPLICRCRECGAVNESTHWPECCPSCGSVKIRLEGEQQVLLQSLEAEE